MVPVAHCCTTKRPHEGGKCQFYCVEETGGSTQCRAHALCSAGRRWHLGCGSRSGSCVQSPKWAQTALSQRLPVSSTVASPKGIKLLKYTFGLCFVKYPVTRQKAEHLMVFRKRQTYFLSGFAFLKQLFP